MSGPERGLWDDVLAVLRPLGSFICGCGCGKPLEDARREARSDPGYMNPDQAEAAVDGTFVFTGKIGDLADAVLPVVQAHIDAAVARAEAAEAALAKAYEHAAFQAGVAQFATKKAWLRQMDLCRVKGGGDG